jgi:hypothetical protein
VTPRIPDKSAARGEADPFVGTPFTTLRKIPPDASNAVTLTVVADQNLC